MECPPRRGSAMSRKPTTYWTIEELKQIVAEKFEAAEKYQAGPKRQQLLLEANRYKSLLATKNWLASNLRPPD